MNRNYRRRKFMKKKNRKTGKFNNKMNESVKCLKTEAFFVLFRFFHYCAEMWFSFVIYITEAKMDFFFWRKERRNLAYHYDLSFITTAYHLSLWLAYHYDYLWPLLVTSMTSFSYKVLFGIGFSGINLDIINLDII